MADTWVRGGRLDNDTSQHDLYTAGNPGQINVAICNKSGSAVNVDLTQSPLGVGDDPSHYVLDTFEVPANDTWFTPFPLQCLATDKIRVKAHTANVIAFRYFGIEAS